MLTRPIHSNPLSTQRFNLENINTIVLEGCGVRFHAYVSAFKVLEKYWNKISRFAASSSGAVPATLAAIGYRPEQIEKITKTLNFSDFLTKTTLSKIPLVGKPLSIYFNQGINSSEKFILFIENLIQQQNLPANLTFEELSELRKTKPELKELYLTGANTSRQGRLEVFCSESERTKNIPISRALLAAIAYPITMIPVKIMIEDKLEDIYDGGVRDIFPIGIFPAEEWIGILGLKVDTLNEIFKPHYQQSYCLNSLYYLIQDEDHHFRSHHQLRSIQIFDANIETLQLNLTPLLIHALDVSGELSTLKFLKHQEKPQETKEEKYTPTKNNDIRKRTQIYIDRIKKGIHLGKLLDEIEFWNDEIKGCNVYYHLLIETLRQQSVFYNLCNRSHYSAFLELLKERGSKAAEKPEASSDLITDILLAYLQDNQIRKARLFLQNLNNNPLIAPKLLHINHEEILKHTTKPKKDSKISKDQEELTTLVETLQEQRLKFFPGAYESNLIKKLDAYIESRKFTLALKLINNSPDTFTNTTYEIAFSQLQKNPCAESEELRILLQQKTGKSIPLTQGPKKYYGIGDAFQSGREMIAGGLAIFSGLTLIQHNLSLFYKPPKVEAKPVEIGTTLSI